ncbi:MAG: hypothetical protein VCB59_02845, partial [Gammaproteobacteria bacterium]
RNLANALTLFSIVTADPTGGSANKKIMSDWLAKYVPLCLEAADGLKAVCTNGADYDEGLAQAKETFGEILAEIDVTLPQGTGL